MDPSRSGRGARRLRDEHPDEAQRPQQVEDVGVERDEVTDLELTLEHEVSAVAEDDHQRERGEEVDEGQEVGSETGAGEGPVHDLVGLDRELGLLAGLGPESLHDADAGDALLDDAGVVTQLVLQLQGHRVQPVREPGRGDAEQGQGTEGEARRAARCAAP